MGWCQPDLAPEAVCQITCRLWLTSPSLQSLNSEQLMMKRIHAKCSNRADEIPEISSCGWIWCGHHWLVDSWLVGICSHGAIETIQKRGWLYLLLPLQNMVFLLKPIIPCIWRMLNHQYWKCQNQHNVRPPSYKLVDHPINYTVRSFNCHKP